MVFSVDLAHVFLSTYCFMDNELMTFILIQSNILDSLKDYWKDNKF